MAIHVLSKRSPRQRALLAIRTAVMVLGIVTLTYLTVTSIEHSRDASSHLGAAAAAAASQTASGPAAPCASFPDMTCSHRYDNSADEPLPPTF